MEANEARVNITYKGENGDLPDPVYFDAADGDIKTWATEAVSNGSVPGIPKDRHTEDMLDSLTDEASRIAFTDEQFRILINRCQLIFIKMHRPESAFSVGE